MCTFVGIMHKFAFFVKTQIMINAYWIYFCSLDINECATNNGNCAHVCTYTNGSYFCTCLTGFALSADHAHCTGMLRLVDSTLLMFLFIQISMNVKIPMAIAPTSVPIQ